MLSTRNVNLKLKPLHNTKFKDFKSTSFFIILTKLQLFKKSQLFKTAIFLLDDNKLNKK